MKSKVAYKTDIIFDSKDLAKKYLNTTAEYDHNGDVVSVRYREDGKIKILFAVVNKTGEESVSFYANEDDVASAIAKNSKTRFKVYASLEDIPDSEKNPSTIYLIGPDTSVEGDQYEEYVYDEDSNEFIKIGNKEIEPGAKLKIDGMIIDPDNNNVINLNSCTPITMRHLCELYQSWGFSEEKLLPGYYRIIDYVTKFTDEVDLSSDYNYKSARIPFDLIVELKYNYRQPYQMTINDDGTISTEYYSEVMPVFSEVAYTAEPFIVSRKRDYIDYYDFKVIIDNPTEWLSHYNNQAVTPIRWMKDLHYGNEAPYDFVNLMFRRDRSCFKKMTFDNENKQFVWETVTNVNYGHEGLYLACPVAKPMGIINTDFETVNVLEKDEVYWSDQQVESQQIVVPYIKQDSPLFDVYMNQNPRPGQIAVLGEEDSLPESLYFYTWSRFKGGPTSQENIWNRAFEWDRLSGNCNNVINTPYELYRHPLRMFEDAASNISTSGTIFCAAGNNTIVTSMRANTIVPSMEDYVESFDNNVIAGDTSRYYDNDEKGWYGVTFIGTQFSNNNISIKQGCWQNNLLILRSAVNNTIQMEDYFEVDRSRGGGNTIVEAENNSIHAVLFDCYIHGNNNTIEGWAAENTRIVGRDNVLEDVWLVCITGHHNTIKDASNVFLGYYIKENIYNLGVSCATIASNTYSVWQRGMSSLHNVIVQSTDSPNSVCEIHSSGVWIMEGSWEDIRILRDTNEGRDYDREPDAWIFIGPAWKNIIIDTKNPIPYIPTLHSQALENRIVVDKIDGSMSGFLNIADMYSTISTLSSNYAALEARVAALEGNPTT